jgi:hypothetical protein
MRLKFLDSLYISKVKKTPAVIVGVFLLIPTYLLIPAAHAAVPTPQVSLTASASKISGTAWTNDGSIGGTATLSTSNTPAPTFQASDTSVALNAVTGTNQYISQSLGNGSVLSNVTFQMNMKIFSTQANSAGAYGMILGWEGTNYDIWYQPGCVGFNTGGGDIYGMSTTSGVLDAYHTFTFVMSTTQDNTSKQKIFMDGVQQSLSLCQGNVGQASKSFGNAPSTYAIGRYGSNTFHGTFNLRSFKLWTSELTTAQIQESNSAQYSPTSHTIALTSGLTTAGYRTASTIRSTSDVDGKVTFLINGKRIPGCISVQTVSKIANCTWRPSIINFSNITARIVASGGSLTTSTLRIFVNKRTGNR